MEVEDLILTKCIGKGAFGEVYLSKKRDSNEIYATKKMKKSVVTQEKFKKYFNNELFILQHVNHENIIKFVEYKATLYNYFLIFEYCNGGGLSSCLEKYKQKNGDKPFPENYCQHLIRQIVSGIYYLHGNKILHRDLKLDNILIKFQNDSDKDNLLMDKATVKIIDFGFARYLETGQLATSVLGSPINMDPKILFKMRKIENNNTFGYDQKADIWSLGTLCYELLVGIPPFDASSYEELIGKLKAGQYKFPENLRLSMESVSFINDMLQFDPNKRKDINYLMSHPFITKDYRSFHPVIMKSSVRQSSFKLNVKESTLWNDIVAVSAENNREVDPNEIMMEVQVSNKPLNFQGIRDVQPDYFEEMEQPKEMPKEKRPREQKTIKKSEERREERPISGRGAERVKKEEGVKPDEDLEKMLTEAFDTINKDSIEIGPMLIPVLVNTDPKISQLDI